MSICGINYSKCIHNSTPPSGGSSGGGGSFHSKDPCKNMRYDNEAKERFCNERPYKDACLQTNCCIYLNERKCVAGNAHGPLHPHDEEGHLIDVDTYCYKDKCYP